MCVATLGFSFFQLSLGFAGKTMKLTAPNTQQVGIAIQGDGISPNAQEIGTL